LEEQVGELLEVIAVGDAVVSEDVAVVPDALDDGAGSAVLSLNLSARIWLSNIDID
jgi:hypothetical protein